MEITAAQVVLPCTELNETLAYYNDELGFALEAIWPADDPAVAVLNGHGLRLRLDRHHDGHPGTLRLALADHEGGPTESRAPNGTVVIIESAEPPLELPPLDQDYVISRNRGGSWGVGRAGMRYRDLIPEREGGRFIASHIHLPDGGPVPDYVHYHHIRFQIIFVRSGWVRLVYEDQGPPFVMEAGDCVLQPPLIRHRVLESSPGLEVIEIGSPAEHQTFADPGLELPTSVVDAQRDFGGQRFLWHRAAGAVWHPGRRPGFEARNVGIDEATGGLADVRVLRPHGRPDGELETHDGEFLFLFVLSGAVTLEAEDGPERLESGDSATLPSDLRHRLADGSADLELLEVRLPA